MTRFVMAFNVVSSPSCWVMTPIFRRTSRGCSAALMPDTETVPSSKGDSPASIRMVVVFPAPFGPSSP